MQSYRKSLDLNLFVVFDALLRHRSVSRAAEALGLSQGAVSKDLNKLRRHFGDLLFLKTREGMAPTDRALALAPDVARFVEFAEQSLVSRQVFDPATSDRVIRLSITDMAELAMVPPLIQRLRQVAPRCRIETVDVPGAEQDLLQAGEVDLVFTGPLKPGAEIRQQKLFEHRYVVIAHRDCPLDGEITAEQFKTLDLVVVRPSRSRSTTITAALARQGLKPRCVLTTPHWLVMPHIVGMNPSCLGIVPHSLAQLYGGFVHVKALTPLFDLPRITVFQYWHTRSDGDAFNTWLRALVREVLYKTPALHMG